MREIKGAVIGCGRMGAFTSDSVKKFSPKCWFPLSHIEALKMSSSINLIAICDTNSSLVSKASLKYGVDHTYHDYKNLLRTHQIDLLCVATRTLERKSIIEYAIKKGVKAIHLEKPLCNSMKQLNELESIVREKEIILSYGTLRPYFNIYKKAKQLVDSGVYGKLVQIQVEFGERQLYWTHPHSVDLILFFAGYRKIVSVQAAMSNVEINPKNRDIESDPIVEQATMYFNDGLVGTISKTGGMHIVLGCETATVMVKSDGDCIVVSSSTELDPYYTTNSGDVIKDDSELPQGTYAAIETLVNSLKSAHKKQIHIKTQKRIFLGQRVLFGFVESTLKNSCIIPISEVALDVAIKGKTGALYA